jgi:hypothetical protein
MRRAPAGPRRAETVESHLRQTRLLAILALAVFVAGVVSDFTSTRFWVRHALLASVAGSVLVVVLSLAVLNEVLERRRRRRWRVLAQYVMFELVRNARMVWSGVLEAAGLFPTEVTQGSAMDAAADVVRDTERLTAAVRGVLDDDGLRSRLHSGIAFAAEHSDEVLGRWAAVMLNGDVYTEVIDRHVELAGDVAWIGGLLDAAHPPDDIRRQRRARSSPAVQIEGEGSNAWLADRIVMIAQLAEALDRGTLELALRIVPVQWWQARLGTTITADRPRAGRGVR